MNVGVGLAGSLTGTWSSLAVTIPSFGYRISHHHWLPTTVISSASGGCARRSMPQTYRAVTRNRTTTIRSGTMVHASSICVLPAQIYGSTQIELAWTIVPLLIVVVLFLVTARYVWGIERRAQPPDALEITVVGNQWWWEIRYQKLGIVTANELHVPVSDAARPALTFITLQSVDVAHSFWIPQLAGKMDAIPNKTNRIWIEPRRVGTYVGQCAEYCGLQHALMLLVVVVHPKDEFQTWVAAQQAAPAEHDATRS